MRTAPTGCLSLLMFSLVLALPFLLANAVPTALAGYQVARIALQAPSTLFALGPALVLNVGLCYSFATPVPQQGIAMQPLIPAGAAALSGLVLAPAWAPPVAFATGVLGPLIGADLLHLGDIADIGTGMASIGGAGTFDGVVLSGLVATLLVPGALQRTVGRLSVAFTPVVLKTRLAGSPTRQGDALSSAVTSSHVSASRCGA